LGKKHNRPQAERNLACAKQAPVPPVTGTVRQTLESAPRVAADVNEMKTLAPDPTVTVDVNAMETQPPGHTVGVDICEIKTKAPGPTVAVDIDDIEIQVPGPTVDVDVGEMETQVPGHMVADDVSGRETQAPGPTVTVDVSELKTQAPGHTAVIDDISAMETQAPGHTTVIDDISAMETQASAPGHTVAIDVISVMETQALGHTVDIDVISAMETQAPGHTAAVDVISAMETQAPGHRVADDVSGRESVFVPPNCSSNEQNMGLYGNGHDVVEVVLAESGVVIPVVVETVEDMPPVANYVTIADAEDDSIIDDPGPTADPNYQPGESESSSSDSLEDEEEGDDDKQDDNNDNKNGENKENFVEEPPAKKRAKKGKSDKKLWKQNQRKILRDRGQQYIGHKVVEGQKRAVLKSGRKLKDRCTCQETSTRQCAVFSEEDRKKILEDVWLHSSWDVRKTYIASLVEHRTVQRKRTQSDNSRRNHTYLYFLWKNGERKQVCKHMFMATTAVGEWSIHNWSKGTDENDNHPRETERKRNSSYYTRAEEDRNFMRREFLDILPKLPSHYCRKSTGKMYLEQSVKSMCVLYGLYKDKCVEHGRNSLSIKILKQEFDDMNLALFQPKKDKCDVCVMHEVGNLSDAEWDQHIKKKDAARNAKQQDKERTKEDERLKVFTMDLQAVLLSPCLKASALYYKTKLCVHNFSIYDLKTGDVVCYVWHEGQGGLNASEFASCVTDYIKKDIEQYDEVVIYSDGCTYQNRNVVMANALLQIAKENNTIIIQKYLEKGHTQMEVDSIHSTIERKLRNMDINVPGEYVNVMKNARSPPYNIIYLEHHFFKDFTHVGPYCSIRPGKKVGDPTVMDLRCIKYTPEGKVLYKLDHECDEWMEMPKPRNAHTENVVVLYNEPLKIKETKFNHLQQLKSVLPKDFHSFYDNLKH
jgi:hypothetical protein